VYSFVECGKLNDMSFVTGFIAYDILLWSFIGVLAATAHYFKTHSR